jgi:glycerol-3-phosphate dehydrogenase (NAD+)
MTFPLLKERVCILGSGNWGSAIATIIGRNVLKDSRFEKQVRMWVHEESINGKLLSEIINETHINVKYLSGITLPDNILAVPDLITACRDATLLVFVLPHQFVKNTCKLLKPIVNPSTTRAVSLIKGILLLVNV